MQIGVILDAQLFDSPKVDRAGATVGTVNGVALVEQELRKICAVLSGDTCDKRCFQNLNLFIYI